MTAALRYTKNNLIRMLARDAEIKLAPERWQDSVSKNIINFNYSKDLPFHLIFTFEQRVYEIVVQDLSNCILERMNQLDNSHNYLQSQVSTTSSTSPILMNFSRPCHIINIDTTDNHTEALTSAHLTLEIVNKVSSLYLTSANIAQNTFITPFACILHFTCLFPFAHDCLFILCFCYCIVFFVFLVYL